LSTQKFSDLDLSNTSLQALDAAGYENPTEIQSRSVPVLMQGSDILATAQTGTGKTAAFVIPMIERLSLTNSNDSKSQDVNGNRQQADNAHGRERHPGRQGKRSGGSHRGTPAHPRALILTPTRELALQIEESIATYGAGARLTCVALFGGASRNKQISQLHRHPDIVVATPGRLEDLKGDNEVILDRVEYLVLDEADRMLDMGFVHSMRRIVASVPKERQTALFSATMPKEIEELAREFLHKPERIAAEAGEVRVERIQQTMMFVPQAEKLDLLHKLISDRGMFRVLVFTRTKHRARKVAKVLLKQGIETDSIHGDKSQGARNRALDAFKKGKIQVLVATDVASRGIDVDEITHVINFEIPNEPETYVHRIGRTARAGTGGEAIALVDESEMAYIKDIEKLMDTTITLDREQPFHEERKREEPRANKPRQSSGRKPQNRGRRPSRGGNSPQSSGNGNERSGGGGPSRQSRDANRSGGGRNRAARSGGRGSGSGHSGQRRG
jgi:ATP-dependent RNA helicase RhlE